MTFQDLPLFLVVFAAIAGLLLLGRYREKRRTRALDGFAQAQGFAEDPDVLGFQRMLQEFKLFNQGRGREVTRLFRGTRDEGQVWLADYRYRIPRSENDSVHQQTLCVVQREKSRLPHFFLRRQVALFDAVGKLFGGEDIDFDDDPVFSKAFVLQSLDGADEARSLFVPEARAALTALASRDVQCEGMNDVVLLHYGRLLNPGELESLLEDTLAVRRALR